MTRPFTFRLQRLLEVRRLREEQAGQELARARGEVAAQNGRLLEAVRLGREEGEAVRPLCRGALDLGQLRLHETWRGALGRRLETEFGRLKELTRIETEKRDAFVKARRDVRVLERLRERQEGIHRLEADRRDQRFLDEVAHRRGEAS